MGGMGEDYRARDTELGCDVAIKVLPAQPTPPTIPRNRLLLNRLDPNPHMALEPGEEGCRCRSDAEFPIPLPTFRPVP